MATTRKPRSAGTGTARRSAAQRTRSGTKSTASRASRQSTPDRDSHGRFKTDHHVRNAAVGAAVTVGAVAAGIAAAFKFGLLDRLLPAGANDFGGHSAEDLLIDDDTDQATLRAGKSRGTGRASPDFRPDMDAPLSKADKEALRPAKGQRAVDLAGADNGGVETA